jgi:predicted transcriptional regulator
MDKLTILETIKNKPGCDLVDIHLATGMDVDDIFDEISSLTESNQVERRATGIRYGYFQL